MGCDYYICKELKINFQSRLSLFIELEKDRGYFDFDLDEDDPHYNKKYKKGFALKNADTSPTKIDRRSNQAPIQGQFVENQAPI